MHYKCILGITGYLIAFIGIAMSLPVTVSFVYNDPDKIALLGSAVLTVAGGLVIGRYFYDEEVELNLRDGFLIVFSGWIMMSFVASFPFVASREIPSFLDACFESVSGFTTTGSTILKDIEQLSHGLLLWRSLIQWIGGMGIIVLSVALLPLLGVGGLQLYKAEVPGPTIDKIRPRVRDTAAALWSVYILLTAVLLILLLAGGMSFFDALCHSFTTLATGGYSTKNASIAAFGSSYINIVITVFMFLAGLSFTLHYKWIHGDIKSLINSSESRWYALLVLAGILFVTVSTRLTMFDSWQDAAEHASFQVVSIITTTGYSTYDYQLWAPSVQFLLLLFMFIGGCAGSTAGGIKIVRIGLLVRNTLHEIRRILHPKAVVRLPFDKQTVGQSVMNEIMAFAFIFLTVFVMSTIILSVTGMDFMSAVGATASALGNIGPGFGSVGPAGTYADLHTLAKLTLMFCMIMGRLELFTILIVFYRGFWRD
jgi:trk system potassium uptake protein